MQTIKMEKNTAGLCPRPYQKKFRTEAVHVQDNLALLQGLNQLLYKITWKILSNLFGTAISFSVAEKYLQKEKKNKAPIPQA